MGINDLAFGADPEENIARLLEAHTKLYDAGLRNFVFANAPPLHRFPSTSTSCDITLSDTMGRVRFEKARDSNVPRGKVERCPSAQGRRMEARWSGRRQRVSLLCIRHFLARIR